MSTDRKRPMDEATRKKLDEARETLIYTGKCRRCGTAWSGFLRDAQKPCEVCEAGK